MKSDMKQLKANYQQDCYDFRHSLDIIKKAKLSLADREKIMASLSANAYQLVEKFQLDSELNKIAKMPTAELINKVRKQENSDK